ncbi:MAG: hypothetical protein ACFFCD_17610 [Promethearchaeota archaeon]
MRSEEELLEKYEEQKERAEADATEATVQGILGQSLRNIGLTILQWVLFEKPTEEEIYAEYIREIERRVKFEKGMRAGRIPFLERNLRTAWLGWILGIPDDEIKMHQTRHSLV